MGETPAVRPFPLSLFPLAQIRIRALLEAADEATQAGLTAHADWLVSKARQDAAALRETIVGLAA